MRYSVVRLFLLLVLLLSGIGSALLFPRPSVGEPWLPLTWGCLVLVGFWFTHTLLMKVVVLWACFHHTPSLTRTCVHPTVSAHHSWWLFWGHWRLCRIVCGQPCGSLFAWPLFFCTVLGPRPKFEQHPSGSVENQTHIYIYVCVYVYHKAAWRRIFCCLGNYIFPMLELRLLSMGACLLRAVWLETSQDLS